MTFATGISAEEPPLIPEDIVGAVIEVGRASGVVVGRTENRAYILTAFHVVLTYYRINPDTNEIEPKERIPVSTEEYIKGMRVVHMYDAIGLNIDSTQDLALLEVSWLGPSQLDTFAKIAIEEPRLGQDIFIISNPNGNNNTISKGIISNKERQFFGADTWQISGGVVYGSSGGGAFNTNGELVSIIKAAEIISGSTDCLAVAKKENTNKQLCRAIVPYLGYSVPLDTIKNFLLKSKAKGVFEYLK